MSGALWAVMAGVGFGFFQSLNRRAVSGMDVYLATFLQLLISAVVLAATSLLTEDLSLLASISIRAVVNFSLAALFHFFIGWTLLNLSQKQIGAARTSPLISTTPLFAAGIAALTLQEFPTWLSLIGIGIMIGGVYVVSSNSEAAGNASRTSGWRASSFGLAAACCWAISPVFIRAGLKDLPSPLLGVTIGIAATVPAYGLLLLRQRRQGQRAAVTTDALLFKVLAGVLVGVSTWMRWVALDLAPVAVALALTLTSVPVVIVLSPLVSGKHLERVTATLWSGAALIVGGALLLILFT